MCLPWEIALKLRKPDTTIWNCTTYTIERRMRLSVQDRKVTIKLPSETQKWLPIEDYRRMAQTKILSTTSKYSNILNFDKIKCKIVFTHKLGLCYIWLFPFFSKKHKKAREIKKASFLLCLLCVYPASKKHNSNTFISSTPLL